MAKKANYKDYANFLREIGHGQFNDVDMTHDGYPLSTRESKFISLFIGHGNVARALRESNMSYKDIAGKDYIVDEIKYRLDALHKETIADADEILQYFTKVMRGEEKDQFGLDAPLAERTRAAQELAKRIIDCVNDADVAVPEIKVTLNWEGM